MFLPKLRKILNNVLEDISANAQNPQNDVRFKMSKNFPHSGFFLREVKEANAFLEARGCRDKVSNGRWEVSVTYQNDVMHITHSYGDKDLYFNTVVGTGISDFIMYGLWEWVAALGIATPDKISGNLIGEKEVLRQFILASAACLKTNVDLILTASDDILMKMEDARAKVREDWEKKSK